MGVHGLWKLIEPSGQMVPLESLAGKVLAVDVSIWLHQALKGMHDVRGAPLAVAHLLILFHRVCKLLFYKIKPVFVFDGGVPALKRQTMAARRQRSSAAKSEAMKVREKLIKNLLKHEAVRHMLADETASAALGLNSFTLPGPSVEEDLYKLPPVAADYVDSEYSDACSSSSDEENEKHAEDIHSIDVTSEEFLKLPAEVRHDILTELIETRKQSSWKYLDSMPKKSDSFSDFQMNRLLKRHAVQTSLEKAGKEMGGRTLSLKELETLLGDQGVLDPKIDLPSKRIAQDNVTRFMLIQKDSESAPEGNENEKFDVMKHLEDVGWSSESETDIISQKSPDRQRRLNERISLQTKQPSEDTTLRNQEGNESSSVSNRAEVSTRKEITDILSILENDDAKTDVKVENTRTEIHLNESSQASEGTVKENTNTTVNLVSVKENIEMSSNELSNESETGISDLTVAACVPESNITSDNKEIKEEKLFEIDDGDRVKEGEDKTEPLLETAPNVPDTAAKVEEIVDSSSDSENDFIPIKTEESDIVIDSIQEKKSDEPPPQLSAHKSDPLTVVINPSELNQKDDLFADIFEPDSGKFSEASLNDRDRVEVNENEAAEKSENVNESTTEVEKEFPVGDINKLRNILEEEQSDLLKEKGKQERLAVNLTDHIYTEAQELLRLFGIPFVVAPMEAEAQCATLNIIGLTEGTITDDSDIWLFGGQVVYKNFFNRQKHVLEYRSENIQKYFKLTREEMIKMALLVGSDYTVGLSGIGPVTALEILAGFQAPNHGLLEGLMKFRDWFTGVATGVPPRAALRKKIKNAVITPGFPNRAVVDAYLHPQVDDSKEPFSWAKPHADLIRKYVKAKLGWSSEKCNEFLLPVLKKFEENTKQVTIDKHFKIIPKSVVIDGMLSKRVENAVRCLGGSSMDSDDSTAVDIKPRKKRKTSDKVCKKSSSKDEESSEIPNFVAKPKAGSSRDFNGASKSSLRSDTSKIKLINEKLYQNVTVPQKEMSRKLLEEKKKEAIKIFRTYKKGGKKKTKVFAKEEVKLSESSSEDEVFA